MPPGGVIINCDFHRVSIATNDKPISISKDNWPTLLEFILLSLLIVCVEMKLNTLRFGCAIDRRSQAPLPLQHPLEQSAINNRILNSRGNCSFRCDMSCRGQTATDLQNNALLCPVATV